MSKCLNVRLVFSTCLIIALSFVIFSCATGANAQSTTALPDDWPTPLSVPGMEKVTGLAQGDNSLSYAVRIISQDGGKINFQVKAFCVSNPQSEYAMLHVLDRPLMGVADPDSKTLQIDFSPLATGLSSVEVIDKADADRVLLQEHDTLVLHTVMAVQSMDSSQVRFSVSDMSLLQPDGVLDEFSLPGPVPAVFDPATARFSTVAFPEVTNALEQNFVYIQQNTEVNVVNVVNQVNVINVADFGGFGGIPFGAYGGYPGYGGFGGYGGYPVPDYGGYYGGYGGASYGGFMPYSEPLPLAPPMPEPSLIVPADVPIYDARPALHAADRAAHGKLPLKERPEQVASGRGGRYADTTPAQLPAKGVNGIAQPESRGTHVPTTGAPTGAAAKAPITRAPIKQGTAGPRIAPAEVKTPDNRPTLKGTAPAAVTRTRAPEGLPAVKPASRSMPATKSAPAQKTSVVKAPYSAPAKQVAHGYAPATRTVSAPKTSIAKAPVRQAPVRQQYSAPKVAYQPARTQAPARHAAPAHSQGTAAGGGRRR